MIAGTDFRGRPGRDADIVARGSRLDEGNYVELELRREDYWEKTQAQSRVVATLALANPVFHYNGDFNVTMAVRNLFIEERDLLVKRLSVWAGSRMYRGDDIYPLDFWPLDNLNTVGGGVRYEFDKDGHTSAALHFGLNRPSGLFYFQTSQRQPALNQFGSTTVEILNRQKLIASAKFTHVQMFNEHAGMKFVAYGEAHALPAGQREVDPEVFEDLPGDNGFVVGGQVGLFSGERGTHLNLYFRYASGLAAYGELGTPKRLSENRTAEGASELLVAAGGNWERGPFGVLLGAYARSFRNAAKGLDADDVDEGIVLLRPHLFFGEWGGLALEGSYQVAQRGVQAPDPTTTDGGVPGAPKGPFTATMARFGVVPFLSLNGRGDYSRPHFRLIYVLSLRDPNARALYPKDDVFNLREIEHFFGFGAEWWFNSSSYGR